MSGPDGTRTCDLADVNGAFYPTELQGLTLFYLHCMILKAHAVSQQKKWADLPPDPTIDFALPAFWQKLD